jgi:hypothetical protein
MVACRRPDARRGDGVVRTKPCGSLRMQGTCCDSRSSRNSAIMG